MNEKRHRLYRVITKDRPAFYIVADDARAGDAITLAAKALGLNKKQPFPSPFSMDLIEGEVVGRVK